MRPLAGAQHVACGESGAHYEKSIALANVLPLVMARAASVASQLSKVDWFAPVHVSQQAASYQPGQPPARRHT